MQPPLMRNVLILFPDAHFLHIWRYAGAWSRSDLGWFDPFPECLEQFCNHSLLSSRWSRSGRNNGFSLARHVSHLPHDSCVVDIVVSRHVWGKKIEGAHAPDVALQGSTPQTVETSKQSIVRSSLLMNNQYSSRSLSSATTIFMAEK